MKKSLIIIIIAIILIILSIVAFRPGNSGEDTWIKDDRGVWVKHGNPDTTPAEVLDQQQLINSALELYNQKKAQGIEFSSQCLGTIDDYAIDIVHIPRSAEDNLVENQCQAYRDKEVFHFLELDKDGNVVRVV